MNAGNENTPWCTIQCDYLNGWIKNGPIYKNLPQNGEPQRYSWGTQKKKKPQPLFLSAYVLVWELWTWKLKVSTNRMKAQLYCLGQTGIVHICDIAVLEIFFGNDLCSTRQTLALFWDCWEAGWSMYGPFRALQCHIELKLKLKLAMSQSANAGLIRTSTNPIALGSGRMGTGLSMFKSVV